MKPNNITVFELFERQQRYVVPLFQRPYVWTKEKQWIPLWEDISTKAEEIINSQRYNHREPNNHFMGAIVLNPIRTSGLQVTAKSIIDGQQRLTTLQIILIALRDFMCAIKIDDLLSTIKLHTENNCKLEHPVERYKVWPTNDDRVEFEAIFNAGSPENINAKYPPVRRKGHHKPDPSPPLISAYLYFYESIQSFVNVDSNEDGEFTPEDQAERLSALVGAFKRHLEIVTIELDENDNPQMIFETLNFRGEPLLPSDLIRNFVFLEATRGGAKVEDLYHQYWQFYDQRGPDGGINFWKAQEKQGRIQRQRIDLFVFHYLVYQTVGEIFITRLYQEFHDWWSREPRQVEAELKSLQSHSLLFQQFYKPDLNTRVGIFLRRLRLLDVTTVYPLLLYLLSRDRVTLPQSELEAMLIDLESYLVRRLVCGLTTKNYNNIFLSLLRNLQKAERLDQAALRSLLTGLTGDSARWPSDREFETAWLSRPVYLQLGHRTRMILEALDLQMRTNKQEEAYRNLEKLTIEHLMPQAWQENYPLSEGLSTEEKIHATVNRENLLHTLGNLTLLTFVLNDSINNGPFTKKYSEITKQSELRLNADLLNLTQPLVWNEDAILKRGQKLYSVAINIWPHR
ncbi:MAG: DUF262 domain-containing protein [Leptolinea sp.]